MLKDRHELERNLFNVIKSSKLQRKNNKDTKDIKDYLSKQHGIFSGDIQGWINDPEQLSQLDVRELYLFTQQVFAKTGNLDINPDEYFTPVQAKEAKIYDASVKRSNLDLPITFEFATIVGNNAYSFPISVQMIEMMMNNQLLHYDPELQREMQVVTDRRGNIRYEPTVIKKNVDEISDHLLNGTLVPTTLVWNAALASSESGEEIVYDSKMRTVTITKDTKLAIVDGMHRIQGSLRALKQNPDLDFNFVLILTNYSKPMAQKYQAQIAEATPISNTRKVQLKAERYADGIVTRLMQESDLKDRISQKTQLKTTANQLVSYNVLADSIDSYMNIITKRDANMIGDFLINFFNELVGIKPEEFIFNVAEARDKSLINNNNIFVGYIILANKMYSSNIPLRKLESIIDGIDFSKDTVVWKEIGVLNEKGKIEDTNKARKAIANYFSELNIEEMVSNE